MPFWNTGILATKHQIRAERVIMNDAAGWRIQLAPTKLGLKLGSRNLKLNLQSKY